MPQLDDLVQMLQQRGIGMDATDRAFVSRHLPIYRQWQGETPQWLATLHVAGRSGYVAYTAAALGELKSRTLEGSGAGNAAWRRLHPLGDAAMLALRLAPSLANLLSLLRILVAGPPAEHAGASLCDARLIDALCDEDDPAWRELPAAVQRLPSSVLGAVQRALRRQPADFSDADVGLRAQVRQVIDWAQAEPGEAGVCAVRRGWYRLAMFARDWMDEHPGAGAPSALPLRVRARHLEAVQLRTPVELQRESMRMMNCLNSEDMADELRRIDRAFFSIRQRETRCSVADLELAYWPRSRRWAIEELKGSANQDPQPDVRAFARALCASFSPRLQLRFPKALPVDAALWADTHPDPGSARLAARFATMLARADPSWLAPFVTRASRYRGALGVDTTGDSLLAAWHKEFGRRARHPTAKSCRLRLLRLPSDARNQPHCLFDVGTGARALAFRADGDGRLDQAAEVFDPALIAGWRDRPAGRTEAVSLQVLAA